MKNVFLLLLLFFKQWRGIKGYIYSNFYILEMRAREGTALFSGNSRT